MKKVIAVIATVVVLLLAAPIIIYIRNFRAAPLSNDPTAWGVLGDYFGGLLNPVLSLANILVLVYITTLVSKVENNRLINEFRHQSYGNSAECDPTFPEQSDPSIPE